MRFVLVLCLVPSCGEPIVDDGERRKPRVDAATPIDSSSGGNGEEGGVVTCYSGGAPDRTCTLPVHCCFFNYSPQRDGYCTNEVCSWGTIVCDGPEDCGNGERCCATAERDPEVGTTGYNVACKAQCGGPDLDYELCHQSSTCSTGSCVTASGNANDLPPALYVCK